MSEFESGAGRVGPIVLDEGDAIIGRAICCLAVQERGRAGDLRDRSIRIEDGQRFGRGLGDGARGDGGCLGTVVRRRCLTTGLQEVD